MPKTINDFNVQERDGMRYVRWEDIRLILGQKDYAKFEEWMMGQTSFMEGAYAGDLRVFLQRLDP